MSRKLFVGMDVHKDTIMIAVYPEHASEPERVDRLPHDEKKLRRYFERLTKRGDRVQACYEASGAGYVLHRWMLEWGYPCDVIAPSLIPRRPGEQRKHDRRDAIELARLYRSGDLVVIRIPSESQERVRDLVRCRNTFQREILKSRHYLLKFLARRGYIFRDGDNWTLRHFAWIRRLLSDGSLIEEDHLVVSQYLALLEFKLQQRDEIDRLIEERALQAPYRDAVARLRSFRGIDTHSAMVLATEIVDWSRFAQPGPLTAYLGLVPREHSSGSREHRGSITKAGNSHCRHVLIQAAWSYRHPPRRSQLLSKRQQGQPPEVIAHAWKAQMRLHKLYRRISERRNSRIAVVAVARELAGFLWAAMQELELEQTRSLKNAA
jgi:transposase